MNKKKGVQGRVEESKLVALKEHRRWSVGRKREVVPRPLRGESLEGLSRELGVEIYRLERWRENAVGGIDAGLREREGDPLKQELDCAMKRIGELTMENELLSPCRVRQAPPIEFWGIPTRCLMLKPFTRKRVWYNWMIKRGQSGNKWGVNVLYLKMPLNLFSNLLI